MQVASASFRGGAQAAPPPGPPPAINHPPFPSVRGQTGAGRPRGASEERGVVLFSMVLAYGQVYTLEASEAPSLTYSSNSRLTDAGQESLHGETWPPRLQRPSSCELGRSRSLTAGVGQTCWPRVTVLPGSEAERMAASQRRTRCTARGAGQSRLIPARARLRGVDIPRDDGLAEARGLMRSVTHCRASQTCASMHWRQCAQMRVELRCESLDPAEPKRSPTRST